VILLYRHHFSAFAIVLTLAEIALGFHRPDCFPIPFACAFLHTNN
jgi:hypothetical protein